MQIKKTYSPQQQLSKVTLGVGKPILSLVDRNMREIFSSGFLAEVDDKSLEKFTGTVSSEKTLVWDMDSQSAEKISIVEGDVKNYLDQEKNKLVEKIKELKNITKGQASHTSDKEMLDKLESFSFDWNDAKGNVYKTDNGYSIIDWGLCDRDGTPIKLDIYEETIETVEGESGNDGSDVGTGPNGLDEEGDQVGPNTSDFERTNFEGGVVDSPKIDEEEDIVNPPKIDEQEDDEPIEKPSDDDWWKKWAIGLGILILMLLVKNCEPRAIMRVTEYQDRYVFDEFGSHDSATFFQRGIFKETPGKDLKTYWKIFKKDDGNTYQLLDSSRSRSRSRIVLDKQIGRFLVELKVEDQGNKLGFLKKSDSMAYSIEINKIFSDLNTLDTIYVVDYLVDDGAPLESSFDTLNPELTIPMKTKPEELEEKISDLEDKIEQMEEEGLAPEEIDEEKEKLEALQNAYEDMDDEKEDESSDDPFKDLGDQLDNIDEIEEQGTDPEEIDEEEEKFDELVDNAIEDQEEKIEDMKEEGVNPEEVEEEKEKLKDLNDISDQNDKIKDMEEEGVNPEEIEEEKEKRKQAVEGLGSRGTVTFSNEQTTIEPITVEPHEGWDKIIIEERDCLNCGWRLKDSYFKDKLGIRHETLLPVAEL